MSNPPTRVNPGRAAVRTANTVLTARTRSYHEPGFRTTLSLKTVQSGVARYGTRRSRYRVDRRTFALLNHGQEYTLDIRAERPVETFALFFAPGFVASVADAATRAPRELLDDPAPRRVEVGFFERLYPRAGAVERALEGIWAALRPRRDALALEQGFHELAGALVGLDAGLGAEVDRCPGVRGGTRRELYQRLHHAHDVLQSCYDEPLTIERLARHACLSPFHFLRAYKALFGRTPLQALQARRCEVAHHLLTRTRAPVADVCRAVGFTSPPSFARLFRRTYGLSPSQVRKIGSAGRRPGP